MSSADEQNSDDPQLYTFFNEIGIIHQFVTARLERNLPNGLRLAHFGVLNHFSRLPGEQTPARLANAFQVTKGAMTNTLGRLEARGFIRIRTNPDDRRSKLVSISAKGTRERNRAIAALGPVLSDLESRLPMAKIRKAMPTLRSVRMTLDEMRDPESGE